jgi:hypothetical protein
MTRQWAPDAAASAPGCRRWRRANRQALRAHASPASTATATTSSSRPPRPRCPAPTTGTLLGVPHVHMADRPEPWAELQRWLAACYGRALNSRSPGSTTPASISPSLRDALAHLLVQRREVGRRGFEELVEGVDDEVVGLVAVDAVAAAHHALQVEGHAPRLGGCPRCGAVRRPSSGCRRRRRAGPAAWRSGRIPPCTSTAAPAARRRPAGWPSGHRRRRPACSRQMPARRAAAHGRRGRGRRRARPRSRTLRACGSSRSPETGAAASSAKKASSGIRPGTATICQPVARMQPLADGVEPRDALGGAQVATAAMNSSQARPGNCCSCRACRRR